jgi:type IV secretion system protein TrbF
MTLLEKPPLPAAAPEELRQWGLAFQGSYIAARQEWLERYGDHIAAAQSWRRVAQMALAVAALALGGLIWVSLQGQIIPYVVRIDRASGVVGVERADRMERPDKTLIAAQLARWVTAVRTVYVDASAQRALIQEGYAMINRLGDAYGALNDHMRAHDPFERAKAETVGVEVLSVLPIAGESWRIEWREDVRGRDGAVAATNHYQATVTIGVSPPRDEATIRTNPLGLYINAFNWARRL